MQTQTPSMQREPTAHCALPPQVQSPVAEHASARRASQPTHRSPPVPQDTSDGGLQLFPEQHPAEHVVLLHPLQRPSVHA